MSFTNLLILGSFFLVSTSFADRLNPGVPTKQTPGKIIEQQRIKGATTQTKVEELPGTSRIGGGGASRETEPATAPRVHISTPNSSGGTSIDTRMRNMVDQTTRGGRATVTERQVRESEKPGEISAGTKLRRDEVAGLPGFYEDEAFANLPEGRLKALLAKKNLTPAEQNELIKLKVELAEMLKAQEELSNRGKGSDTAKMMAKVSEINDVIAARMDEIKGAVAEAERNGKVVPSGAVNDLLRNVINTYAGLGYKMGGTGKEELGLEKALTNLKELKGDQLVGYIKYLHAYGSEYRFQRGVLGENGLPKYSIETAHDMATKARRDFVDGRAATAKVEALRNKKNLNDALCKCTGSCAV